MDQTESCDSTKKWWQQMPRFGLLQLLLVVPLLGAAIGTLGIYFFEGQKNRLLEEKIKSVGGDILYDNDPAAADRVAYVVPANTLPWMSVPDTIEFGSVVTAESLAAVNARETVSAVAFVETPIGGPEFANWSLAPHIRQVEFYMTPSIDKTILRRIASLPSLAGVVASGPGWGDGEVQILKDIPQLRLLAINSAPCSSNVISEVLAAHDLTLLDLGGDQLDDAMLTTISTHVSLRRLRLSGRKFTGAGLTALKNLPSLEYLDIAAYYGDSSIVEALRDLKFLKELTIAGPGAQSEWMPTLQQQHSDCRIGIIPSQ